jgi:LemA protein
VTQNQWLLALVALLAIHVFWMVGAYNRLVALRSAIGLAWSKVDEALRQRALAADPLLAALREPMAAEQGALDATLAALAEVKRSAAVMGARPVVAENAAAWTTAEASLSASASRLFALLEHNEALQLQGEVTAHTRSWRDADTRLAFARQLFNEAAEVYNGAIALFPTRLLVPMFRFSRAGRI